jgi:protein involved in plasmid replication-relaxation
MEPRDLAALRLIARFRMVTRPQLRRARFRGLSETVTKRSIDRLLAAGYLGAERVSKTGYQVLWCTSRGRDHLVEQGISAADLFPARGPAAAKDFRHTERIIDVAITFMERGWREDDLLPAWALQRLFGARVRAIPDLLVLERGSESRAPVAIGVEVDLGSEALTVFVPKLQLLAAWLAGYGAKSTCALLVLTTTPRRRDALRARVETARLGLRVSIECIDTFTTARST